MAKHSFQTEVNQILHLVIHSLYSHKEIFLRELISNSSDALDKLKFLTLTDDKYKDMEFNPKIEVFVDKKKKSLTISDNGIGMNEVDLIEHLGTVAKSGTKSFIEQLTGDSKKDSNLIGQFGVGFYSSFMVAKKVEVFTKKAGEEKTFVWVSEGKGEFDLAQTKDDKFKNSTGTSITLYLNDSESEFLETYRLENIVEKYSNHIPFAIYLEKEKTTTKKVDDKDVEEKKSVLEQINKASAIWTMNKGDLKKDDYDEFYKTIGHDYDEPLAYFHTKAEGTLEYSTLFYIPKKAPFDLFRVDYTPGVKLYVNRVFITDDDKELMPTYLRFVKGVIDSSDLPLNVSREILQSNKILSKIKSSSVKKILQELSKMMNKDSEKYSTFYNEFGKVLKEGLYSDHGNKEAILGLLKFKSAKFKDETVSLAKYKESMGEDQKEIYFTLGKDEKILRNSPILNKFKDKGFDVLILDEEVDAIVFPMVSEYKKLKFVNVNDASLDEESKEDKEKLQKEHEGLVNDIKDILKDKIKDVRVSSSLKDSPVCAVTDKDDPSFAMAQMMKQMGNGDIPEVKSILDVNPEHDLIKKFSNSSDTVLKEDIANLLLDQSRLYNGEEIKDTVSFVDRINRVITKAL